MKEPKYGLIERSGSIETDFEVGSCPEIELKFLFRIHALDPNEKSVGEDIQELVNEIEEVVNRFTSQIKE